MSDTIDTTEQIIEDDPIAVRRAKREALMAARARTRTMRSRTRTTWPTWLNSTPTSRTARPPRTR